MTERFLSRLRPGSVVLHQDFAGPRLPWLHHSTGALLPYIEIAGPPIRSTLAFEVVRPIPEDVLKSLAEDTCSVDEKLALISAVQERIDRDHTGGIRSSRSWSSPRPTSPTTPATTGGRGRWPSR